MKNQWDMRIWFCTWNFGFFYYVQTIGSLWFDSCVPQFFRNVQVGFVRSGVITLSQLVALVMRLASVYLTNLLYFMKTEQMQARWKIVVVSASSSVKSSSMSNGDWCCKCSHVLWSSHTWITTNWISASLWMWCKFNLQ